MQITGGKVTFGRSVQPAQYETKKAEVEIAFTLSEGEALGATLDTAGSLAQSKALELVGLKPAGAQPPAAKAPERTKADLEAEALAKAKGETEKAPKAPKAPPKTKPAETKADAATTIEEPTRQISTAPEDRKPDPATDLEDPLSVPAAAITDAELTSAVTQHNAKIKNPTAIRGLIQKFVGKTPCTVVQIAPEVRAKFIEELKKL